MTEAALAEREKAVEQYERAISQREDTLKVSEDLLAAYRAQRRYSPLPNGGVQDFGESDPVDVDADHRVAENVDFHTEGIPDAHASVTLTRSIPIEQSRRVGRKSRSRAAAEA